MQVVSLWPASGTPSRAVFNKNGWHEMPYLDMESFTANMQII
jgi:hypothetical protein